MGSHHSWKTDSISCLASSTPSSPVAFQHLSYYDRWASSLVAFNFVECFVDLCRRHTGRGASSWRDPKELAAWPHKFNIEQSSIMLDRYLHLVFVSERKLASIIAYTIITSNVLVSAIHLVGDMENTITIWEYCGEFLFLHSQTTCLAMHLASM